MFVGTASDGDDMTLSMAGDGGGGGGSPVPSLALTAGDYGYKTTATIWAPAALRSSGEPRYLQGCFSLSVVQDVGCCSLQMFCILWY